MIFTDTPPKAIKYCILCKVAYAVAKYERHVCGVGIVDDAEVR